MTLTHIPGVGNLASGVWGGISGGSRKSNVAEGEVGEERADDEAQSSAANDGFF